MTKREDIEHIAEVPEVAEGWEPIEGQELQDLRARLQRRGISDEAINLCYQEARSILGNCLDPKAPAGAVTGLVCGYVQSGKTQSFTAVAALARDNGYRLVILIAGASHPLFKQSGDRLDDDLDFSNRRWHIMELNEDAVSKVQARLDSWHQPNVRDYDKKPVLLTVLKHHSWLEDLAALLTRLNLDGVPTLIIDDEADQITPNTKAKKGGTSTTYQRVMDVRSNLPHLSYLEYTATPQALLLISLSDSLSPEFVQVLTPGSDYVGGKVFFKQREKELIRIIPPEELPIKEALPVSPPPTLREAMMTFLLGVAAGYGVPPEKRGNRSMLIHPSRLKATHLDYAKWARAIKEEFSSVLNTSDTEPDKPLLISQFSKCYAELKFTISDLAPFEELVKDLPQAIRDTNVQVVHSGKKGTPSVDWENEYSHIVVGGQAMDRGYTVRGLTVTYMPRGIGVGNVDTLQQRARFFGYKRGYLGFCRIYLDQESRDFYHSYVEQEENVRWQLQEVQNRSKPLKEWRRRFYCDARYKLTRDAVIQTAYRRGDFTKKWFEPGRPFENPECVAANRALISEFLLRTAGAWGALPDQHKDCPPDLAHDAAVLPLRQVFNELLVPFQLSNTDDAVEYAGLLLQVERYFRDRKDAETPATPEPTCLVIRMGRGKTRTRMLNSKNTRVREYHQGALPGKSAVYPGDDKIVSPVGLTVQIHYNDIYENAGRRTRGRLLAAGVPALVIRGSPGDAMAWAVQDERLGLQSDEGEAWWMS